MAKLAKLLQAVSGAGGGDSYWVAEFVDTNPTTNNREDITLFSVDVDSNGNIYSAGKWNNKYYQTSAVSILALKMDTDGALLWDTHWYGSADSNYGSITVGTTDIPYVGFETNSNSAGYDDLAYMKLNPSTGAVTQRRMVGTSNPDSMDLGTQIGIDSNENIYIGGETGASLVLMMGVKINSSNTTQAVKSLGAGTRTNNQCIHVNRNNNYIYWGGNELISSTMRSKLGVMQSDMSTSAFSGTYYYGSDGGTIRAITTDSSSNCYIAGYSGLDAYVAKLNPTTGAITWDVRFDHYTTGNSCYGVGVLSTGDVVVANNYYDNGVSPAGNRAVLTCFDSSGSFNWNVSFNNTNGSNTYIYGLTIDADDNIIICGNSYITSTGKRNAFVAKLPSDGTTYGTVGNWTIGTPRTISSNTGNMIKGTRSFSASNLSYSQSSTFSYTQKLDETYFDDTTTDL